MSEARRWPSVVFSVLCTALVACGSGDDDGGCPDDASAVPDVAGDYLVEIDQLRSSNCPAAVDDLLEEVLDESNSCVYDLSQDGARLLGTSCDGLAVRGCVDSDGNASVTESASESQQGCNVRIDATIEANLIQSPSNGQVDFRVRISGNCILQTDCVARTDATVTEVLPLASTSASDSPPRGPAGEAARALSATLID